MAIKPVVRYMLLCEDWELDPESNRKINILGLVTNIRSLEDPPRASANFSGVLARWEASLVG